MGFRDVVHVRRASRNRHARASFLGVRLRLLLLDVRGEIYADWDWQRLFFFFSRGVFLSFMGKGRCEGMSLCVRRSGTENMDVL